MVKIMIQKGKALRLHAQGHAGAGKKGADLVCCAVSTLLCTLAAALEKTGGTGTQLASGLADIRAPRTVQTLAAFSFAETGLRALAAQFPRFISLTTQQEEAL